MKIEQIYTNCLAQGAYYLECDGEAIVIDPLREVDTYINLANANKAKIKYVMETHFHADFVSGHLDLAKATGAKIVYGPTAKPNFPAIVARDGEVFHFGSATLTLMHTPGHTMESSCFLLRNSEGEMQALFTGDTLFIGDVGRPDLAVKSDLSKEDLASHLYDSLMKKIMPLPDNIIVYPGHGAGSACGKNLGKETQDTLGNQKKTNYALRPGITREEFIKEVTGGLLPPPAYFPVNARMNKEGYPFLDSVKQQALRSLRAETVKELMQEGALLIDTRKPGDFASAHIPGSWNIGIDGQFAPWVGALIPDARQTIVIVCDEGREEEIVVRLARVGYDHCIGYLKGGIESWKKAGFDVEKVQSISPDEFVTEYKKGAKVVDVRRNAEYLNAHLENAQNIPLDYIHSHINEFPTGEKVYVHCAGGYRSMIAASILYAMGHQNIVNVEGGFSSICDAGIPQEKIVLPEIV